MLVSFGRVVRPKENEVEEKGKIRTANLNAALVRETKIKQRERERERERERYRRNI